MTRTEAVDRARALRARVMRLPGCAVRDRRAAELAEVMTDHGLEERADGAIVLRSARATW